MREALNLFYVEWLCVRNNVSTIPLIYTTYFEAFLKKATYTQASNFHGNDPFGSVEIP